MSLDCAHLDNFPILTDYTHTHTHTERERERDLAICIWREKEIYLIMAVIPCEHEIWEGHLKNTV